MTAGPGTLALTGVPPTLQLLSLVTLEGSRPKDSEITTHRDHSYTYMGPESQVSMSFPAEV